MVGKKEGGQEKGRGWGGQNKTLKSWHLGKVVLRCGGGKRGRKMGVQQKGKKNSEKYNLGPGGKAGKKRPHSERWFV